MNWVGPVLNNPVIESSTSGRLLYPAPVDIKFPLESVERGLN